VNTARGLESCALSERSANIRLDPRIYSREAILKACYWYTDLAHVRCPESSDGSITVFIELKRGSPTLDTPVPMTISEVIGDFCNSLLDFELRRQVESETGVIRQLILAKAFSESGVLEDDPPGSIADPVERKKPSSLVQIMNAAISLEKT
jgi:His-Xaa-Ser system protein HxsD